MKKVFLTAVAIAVVLAAVTLARTQGGQNKKEIVGLIPEQVRWFTPPYYKDGRLRATQVKTDHGLIELRYLPASRSSHIRTRRTNS